MPKPGKRWRHVTLGIYNSWLPGDPRGFRTWDHKLHSSGDCKNPPREGEHSGLHEFSKRFSGPVVIIPWELREVAGRKILKKLRDLDHEVLAIAVAGMHTHIQVELPDDVPTIRQIVGDCKRAASHAIRAVLPGRVWARDGGYKRIDNKGYHRNVFRYILQQKDAWIWSYKDAPADGG